MIIWFLFKFGRTYPKILIEALKFDSIKFYFSNIEGTGARTIMKAKTLMQGGTKMTTMMSDDERWKQRSTRATSDNDD